MSELSILDVLEPGPLGDTSIDMRLTAREVAALQLLVTLATDEGSPALIEAQLACDAHGVGHRWNVALRSALVRIGIAAARVLRQDQATEFSALLAELDQETASLDDGKESRGD